MYETQQAEFRYTDRKRFTEYLLRNGPRAAAEFDKAQHEFGVCGGLLKDLQGRRALVCRPRIPAVYRPERRTSHCFRESRGMPEGTGNVLVCALACGAPGAAVCRLRGC
jgi:hypothetical protein